VRSIPPKSVGISKGTPSPRSVNECDVEENGSPALTKETLANGLTVGSTAATRRLAIASNFIWSITERGLIPSSL